MSAFLLAYYLRPGYAGLPVHPPIGYVSPWGEAPSLLQKVERRTDVHIGIRDSIVHVDIKRPRLTAIVRITTAQNEPETRTPGHRDDSLERKYTLKRIWKKVKELKKIRPLRGMGDLTVTVSFGPFWTL